MNISNIGRLYAYDDWANERILAAVAGLSGEQWTRHVVSSFPSVRETVAHIAFAEWLWLQRWNGVSPAGLPEWVQRSDLPALQERMRDVANERRAFLAGLTDESLESVLHYTSTQGDPFALPLGELLIHVANHSTYHRGQLVTMLRQVGAQPPNTDYTQFLRS